MRIDRRRRRTSSDCQDYASRVKTIAEAKEMGADRVLDARRHNSISSNHFSRSPDPLQT